MDPLATRWSYLPKALPWRIKYLLSGWTEACFEKTTFARRALLKDAPLLHRNLAEECSVAAARSIPFFNLHVGADGEPGQVLSHGEWPRIDSSCGTFDC